MSSGNEQWHVVIRRTKLRRIVGHESGRCESGAALGALGLFRGRGKPGGCGGGERQWPGHSSAK
jgi:hypothetical protein